MLKCVMFVQFFGVFGNLRSLWQKKIKSGVNNAIFESFLDTRKLILEYSVPMHIIILNWSSQAGPEQFSPSSTG